MMLIGLNELAATKKTTKPGRAKTISYEARNVGLWAFDETSKLYGFEICPIALVKHLSTINLKYKEKSMPTTTENLKEAFAGESQANQKYRAFAKKAEKEGFVNIAKLFRTTAEAERIHAEGHLKSLEMIASTAENLQAAINGETFEFTKMYPPMIEKATVEGHKAKTMFRFAVEAEEVHAKIYSKALEAVKRGIDLETGDFYLCPICGYIEMGKAADKCPVCGALPKVFHLVD